MIAEAYIDLSASIDHDQRVEGFDKRMHSLDEQLITIQGMINSTLNSHKSIQQGLQLGGETGELSSRGSLEIM